MPRAGNGAFQPAATAAQAGFYSNNSAGLQPADLARPYSEIGFELSPLNRPLTERAPGNKSAASNISYGANTAGEVKRYDYAANANILLTVISNADYLPGKLYRTQTIDENGKTSIEFTDVQGRLVCRKVSASDNEILATYYVYDDFSQLRAVLQPQYQDNPSAADFAFLYEYDIRGHVVGKKIPGSGFVNLVYDNFDRQLLSQDAAQLARGVWGFVKYDALNRAVLTGEISSASNRSVWQASINASQVHHEDKAAGGVGYTIGNTLPIVAEANVFTVNYYDDYGFPKPANLGYVNTYGVNSLAIVKGLQTGSRTRMLAAGNQWLASGTYYDAEYRPIQTTRELHDLGAGAIERVSTQYKYDLAPVIAQEKTEQIIASGTNVHLKTYEYDHADRLLSIKESVTAGGKSKEATTIAQRYSALGQLQQKWFHSEDGIYFRRKTIYTHNIRGWLAQGQTFYKIKENEPDSTFYNFALSYANGNSYTNGNISQMQWSGKAENTFTKGLTFSYDGANRLLGSAGLNNYKETESGISYDKNGNIKTLIRSGAVLDNLNYAYLGNRLSAVTDASGTNLGVKSGVSNYSYDGNGNMTSDGNRGAVLTYNYLNLPKTVSIGGKTLTYDYDAAGSKHKYVADTLTVKYAGNFEYNQSNTFKRLSISDGQAVFRKDTIRFDYYLKDHLGNVRVVFDEKGRILQQTDYYPFGLEIDRNAPVQTPSARNNVNRFLYNGKELQVGTGLLDYGARMYMPEIGRWGVVDPMAEKYYSYSPFVYSINDPVLLNDPDGRDIDVSRFKSKDEQAILKQFLSTKAGYAIFAQFANKGDKIGGVTFKVAGERSNDLLAVQSTDHVNMVTDNGQTSTYEKKNPSDNQDRPGSIYGKSLQNADNDTDVGKGVIHLIRINQEQGGVSKLNTLSHEAFVHVQEDINRLRALQNSKAIKPGTAEYIRQLQYTGTSSVVDHAKLGQGKVQGYQNISAQLDKLNSTKLFTELYKRDVNNQKGN